MTSPLGLILTMLMLALAVVYPAFPALGAGKIDWLQGYVSATGRGYAKKSGSPLDADNAIDAAKVEAYGELLETAKGVMVDKQTAVGDLMTEKTETSIRVRGVIQNAVLVGEPQVKESGEFMMATVEMRICLYANGRGCRTETPLVAALPSNLPSKAKKDSTCNLLPNIHSTQEILKKVTYDTNKALSIVVVSLKGKKYDIESKDFVIGYETENGDKCSVYTPDKIDPIVRRDRGAADILLRLAEADKKYGANKIIISAIAIGTQNYILIDSKDAYLLKLLDEKEKNKLFKEARIALVLED